MTGHVRSHRVSRVPYDLNVEGVDAGDGGIGSRIWVRLTFASRGRRVSVMNENEIVERLGAMTRGNPQNATLASRESVAAAEESLGHPIPSLLRRVYLEVANGGIGPQGGILGLPGGNPTVDWEDVVEASQELGEDPDVRIPPEFLWILDWGCSVWSIVDCREESGPMWAWDGNLRGDRALFSEGRNLADWFAAMAQGTLQMPQPKPVD